MFHKIGAYPVAISCGLGAGAVDAIVVGALVREFSVGVLTADGQALAWLGVLLVPISLLGCFGGMVFCWPWVRVICSRFNGAPHQVGERVRVLAGRHAGKEATVYEKTVGQGGWMLARLDLGEELREKFGDLVEEYQVMKVGDITGGAAC